MMELILYYMTRVYKPSSRLYLSAIGVFVGFSLGLANLRVLKQEKWSWKSNGIWKIGKKVLKSFAFFADIKTFCISLESPHFLSFLAQCLEWKM